VKEELRARLRRILDEMPREELLVRSADACHRLTNTVEYRKSTTIMVFLSLPREPDTTPLVLQAWRDGKRVCAPKMIPEDRRLVPTEIHSLHQDVSDMDHSMREPVAGTTVAVGEIDLAVLPGLGFDAQGYRLGRGIGCYDRFLAHRDYRAVACGLGLEDQFVLRIPAEPHDRCLDMLVTDQAVRRFRIVAHK
jgi:5-formyltetrahydrofolate cyclo-ligase